LKDTQFILQVKQNCRIAYPGIRLKPKVRTGPQNETSANLLYEIFCRLNREFSTRSTKIRKRNTPCARLRWIGGGGGGGGEGGKKKLNDV